jgi:peptidoglycan/xylan/chitin deacetylase (PgdA/CDA1 family)
MITFDDGHADVYQHAYPILEQYGFSAAMYVVANRAGVPGFLSVDEMKQLTHSGWEIGSHTMSHADLAELNDQDLEAELTDARQLLEASLGVAINSLAYPFGSFSPDAARAAVGAGYTNAMGIGVSNNQSMANRFYFNRREVHGQYGQEEFMQLFANGTDGSISAIKDSGGSASLSANSGEVGWSFRNESSSTGSSGDSVQTIQ